MFNLEILFQMDLNGLSSQRNFFFPLCLPFLAFFILTSLYYSLRFLLMQRPFKIHRSIKYIATSVCIHSVHLFLKSY